MEIVNVWPLFLGVVLMVLGFGVAVLCRGGEQSDDPKTLEKLRAVSLAGITFVLVGACFVIYSSVRSQLI
ncbi:hypothetical protein [Proteus phage P16-2532]|nr:hypothetical protein [Proteus phage P16-2532]